MTAGAAGAQGLWPWRCDEPRGPSIPSGLYHEHWQMESARRELEHYLQRVQDYRECLADKHRQAGDDAQLLIEEWNGAVRNFNLMQ